MNVCKSIIPCLNKKSSKICTFLKENFQIKFALYLAQVQYKTMGNILRMAFGKKGVLHQLEPWSIG